MTEHADRFVVVLDANVLYPFTVRDALLRFAEAGLYRARWSRKILSEWKNALLRKNPHLSESIEAQVQAMETTFPEALVTGHEYLAKAISLPDEDDAHVLAAAICCGAQHIVTENLKDFPDELLHPMGMEAISADAFLSNTFELYGPSAVAALRQMRRHYEKPEIESL